PQDETAAAKSEPPDYNGLDFTRPQRSIALRFQYRTSSSPSNHAGQKRIHLELGEKISLPYDWTLGFRLRVPFVDKSTTDQATQNVDHESGLGDGFLQTGVSHDIDKQWAFGFGARFVSPTATDSLGNGKWQVMPIFGVRYSFPNALPNSYFSPAI